MIPIKFVPAELQASRVLIGQLGQYISHGKEMRIIFGECHRKTSQAVLPALNSDSLSSSKTSMPPASGAL